MTISQPIVAAELNVGLGHTLAPVSGTITLDDAWSPYAQASLKIYTPDETVLDLLDPREGRRVVVTVSKEFGDWNPSAALVDQERVFNLLLRARTVDHTTGTTDITLSSDEALLQDFALVATEPERTYGVSVKDAVEYVLDKVDALLEAGAADAEIESDVDAPPVVTNLIPNPSAEVGLTGVIDNTGNAVLSRSTAQHWVGAASFAATASGSGASGVWWGGPGEPAYIPVVAGEKYCFSVYVRNSVSRPVAPGFRWYSAPTTTVGSDSVASTVDVGTTWTRVSYVGTAPVGANFAAPFVYGVSFTSGNVIYADAAMLTHGETLEDYFDGDTDDPGLIGYEWTGTDHNSPSTMTYLPNSDAMIWPPGVTAWDYLQPLLQSTGLRLFCDEHRNWILETTGTLRDGIINVSAQVNVTQATDQISRDTDSWFDSVVIAYTRNVDEAGQTTTIYDVAGAPGTKTLKLDYERPYPGAGAAESILGRAQGRGRVLQLESVSNYLATPGMAVSASLPDSPIQTGVISSVKWAFPIDRMNIGSRGLTDTPESSWLLAAEDLAWEDLADGIDWTEYTP